jgi:O-antigen/teichoic acid export membrane protein
MRRVVTRLGARLGLSGDGATRATMTMADQCVASSSNFAVGVIVARLSGAAGLGSFALAYTCWILLNTLHRSLVTDPMAIWGDMRREDRDDFVRRGFAAELAIGLAATFLFAAVGFVVLLFGQRAFGEALLAVAPWLTVLNLQDYWRWIGFMQATPRKSLMNDIVFNAVQAIAFVVIYLDGQRSVFAVVAAWGSGAAVASVYGFRQFSVSPSVRGGLELVRSRLTASRWLAGERIVSWGANWVYLILAGVLLGPAALGGLRAAQALVSGPSTVVMNAGGSLGLPEASRQFGDRGWAGLARVSRLITGAGVASSVVCGLVVFVAGGVLMKLLYGPAFVAYTPSARLFGVSFILGAFTVGPLLTLTTTVRTRPLFIAQLLRIAVSVVAVCVLSSVAGVTGVAAASVVGAAAVLAVLLLVQSSTRRSVESGSYRPSPTVNTLDDREPQLSPVRESTG